MKKQKQLIKYFSELNLAGRLSILFTLLLLLGCLCSAPNEITSQSTSTIELQSTVPNKEVPSQTAINTKKPTEIPTIALTSTPNPTNTPFPPTATQNPNIINPGTYIVGVNIQPRIYRGFAGDKLTDSCYWARLKDLLGSIDSILANDNSIGQFYIDIQSNDYAIETYCSLVPLDSIPPHTGDFPQTIKPGMYLVGRDILPGTYKGQAGTDISSSCYWARLSNVTGEIDSIIANDNSVGQFYVQIASSDFALSSACELILVE
jgi:hypothetical protein